MAEIKPSEPFFPGVPDAILLGAITASIYTTAYSLEMGYCFHFGLPTTIITISKESLVYSFVLYAIVVLALTITWWAIIKYSALLGKMLPPDKKAKEANSIVAKPVSIEDRHLTDDEPRQTASELIPKSQLERLWLVFISGAILFLIALWCGCMAGKGEDRFCKVDQTNMLLIRKYDTLFIVKKLNPSNHLEPGFTILSLEDLKNKHLSEYHPKEPPTVD